MTTPDDDEIRELERDELLALRQRGQQPNDLVTQAEGITGQAAHDDAHKVGGTGHIAPGVYRREPNGTLRRDADSRAIGKRPKK